MDQAAIDAHLAERRRIVAAKGAIRLREASSTGDPGGLESELHRLAGTLGTFGLHAQSALARRLLVGCRDGTLAGPALDAAVDGLIGELEEVS